MSSPRRVPRWARVLAALVVAGLVALPLGGWDTVDRGAGEAEALEPGQRHVAEQFATTLERAEVVPVRPGSSLDPEPGVAYLVLHAVVENRTDATEDSVSDLLLVEAGERELGAADTVDLLEDGSFPALSPGLPTALTFTWEIAEGDVGPGDVLEVSVVDRTETESPLTSRITWLFPRVGAVADLEVG